MSDGRDLHGGPDGDGGTGELDGGDAGILRVLRAVHEATDPVPAGLGDRVKFALTVHELHADVAELIDLPLAATRQEGTARTETVTFGHGPLSLMVDVGPAGPGHARLDGWVTSGGAEVEAVTPDARLTATADAHGRFVLAPVPLGPVYFVVRAGGGARPVVTPSIEL